MGVGQYLSITFLGGWTSIYQLFWCSPGVQGFDTLPYVVTMFFGHLIHLMFTCNQKLTLFVTTSKVYLTQETSCLQLLDRLFFCGDFSLQPFSENMVVFHTFWVCLNIGENPQISMLDHPCSLFNCDGHFEGNIVSHVRWLNQQGFNESFNDARHREWVLLSRFPLSEVSERRCRVVMGRSVFQPD